MPSLDSMGTREVPQGLPPSSHPGSPTLWSQMETLRPTEASGELPTDSEAQGPKQGLEAPLLAPTPSPPFLASPSDVTPTPPAPKGPEMNPKQERHHWVQVTHQRSSIPLTDLTPFWASQPPGTWSKTTTLSLPGLTHQNQPSHRRG